MEATTYKKMKNLLMLIIALALSTTAFSQAKMGEKMKMNHKMDMKRDHIMMKDGQMKMMKNGEEIPMDKEMTMQNGTKVMADGMYTNKDGATMTMKNGDMMDMEGMISKMPLKGKSTKKGRMGKMKMQ